MNVTNHAKLRYVQRIVGISDERESRNYLAEHNEEVSNQIIRIHEESEYVWSGIVNNHKLSHFYINDDIVTVVNEEKQSIVTLYRCDFGFPESVNKNTIRNMMVEIRKLRKREQREEEKIAQSRDKIQVQLDTVEMQIQAVESQLEILRKKQSLLKGELESVQAAPIFTRQEIAKVAALMVNSLDYKMDVLGMKKSV